MEGGGGRRRIPLFSFRFAAAESRVSLISISISVLSSYFLPLIFFFIFLYLTPNVFFCVAGLWRVMLPCSEANSAPCYTQPPFLARTSWLNRLERKRREFQKLMILATCPLFLSPCSLDFVRKCTACPTPEDLFHLRNLEKTGEENLITRENSLSLFTKRLSVRLHSVTLST